MMCARLALLALASLAIPGPGRAGPAARGHALVVGIDTVGGQGDRDCKTAASSVRDRLAGLGVQVSFATDPGPVAFRSALDDFAAQLGGAGTGTTLIYLCAPALASDARLFVLAHAGEPGSATGPETQDIVAPALLNALAGTGGTLYADLDVPADPQSDQAVALLRGRVQAGTHLAIATSGRSAPLGAALAGGAADVTASWAVQASVLATRIDARQAGLTLEPAPPALRPAPAVVPALAVQVAPPAPSVTPALPAARLPIPVSRPGPAAAPSVAKPSVVPQPAAAPPPTRSTVSRPRLTPLPTVAVAPLPTPPQARSAASVRLAEHRVGAVHPPDPASSNRRVAREQAALIRMGLYHGPVDGNLDGETLMAIRTFQHSLGDPESGSLNGAEIVRLLNP